MTGFSERLREAVSDSGARTAQDVIRSLPLGGPTIPMDKPEGLAGIDERDWGRVCFTLTHSPLDYEGLLRRISFRREMSLPKTLHRAVTRFLASAYVLSGDVRYFNEYLWFEDRDDSALGRAVFARYNELSTDVFHPFPLASAEQVRAATATERPGPESEEGKTLKVALLGNPLRFARLHERLRTGGMEPVLVFFPWHRRQFLETLLRRPPISLPLLRALGNRLPVQVVPLVRTDPGITAWLRALDCPVALHRLGFIVRKSVLDAFPQGILNDHLAVLPHIRGRATVEYSILYGFPICSTVHILDEGIDTGPIVDIFPIDVPRGWSGTCRQLKDQVVMRDKDQRFAESLRRLRSPGFQPRENPKTGGVQHYTLHPALRLHIDTMILPEFIRRFGV